MGSAMLKRCLKIEAQIIFNFKLSHWATEIGQQGIGNRGRI